MKVAIRAHRATHTTIDQGGWGGRAIREGVQTCVKPHTAFAYTRAHATADGVRCEADEKKERYVVRLCLCALASIAATAVVEVV